MVFDRISNGFRPHSKSRPFANPPLFEHSKSRHVQFLELHCISVVQTDYTLQLFFVIFSFLQPREVTQNHKTVKVLQASCIVL